MCGIAGYITKGITNYKHAVAIAVLAKHMDERGGHSWGTMDHTGATERGLGSINTGLSVRAEMPASFALHTRYGTTGANSLANAHPFTIDTLRGPLVGMHNGIISNHGELNKKHTRKCTVDSQHIFENIAAGVSLNELCGYGTIVYQHAGEWYIGRFNDGELSIAKTDAGIFYASTKDALLEALSFAGVPVKKWLKVKNDTVYRLTPKGIEKAFSVDAQETSRRWNDNLSGSLNYGSLNHALTVRKDEGTLYQRTGQTVRCELCGEYTSDNLYDIHGDFGCADCYFAVTGQIPADFLDDEDISFEDTAQHYRYQS